MISFFFQAAVVGRFSRNFTPTCAGNSENCCRSLEFVGPRLPWTLTIEASEIRFVSLAEEPMRADLGPERVGSQTRLSCPRDRGCRTLRRMGGRFSRNFGNRHCGIIVGSAVLIALGGPFTTWHFIVVISAQQGCAKEGKAELPKKDSPAIGRSTCGGPSTVLCRAAKSAARMDDHVASVSAQTFLGGVLGGNLAFYTMITSRTGL